MTDTLKTELSVTLKPVIESEVSTQLEQEIRDILEPKLRESLEIEIADELAIELRTILTPKISDELTQALNTTLAPAIESQIRAQLEAEIRTELEPELRTALESEITEELNIELRTILEPKIKNALEQELQATWTDKREDELSTKLRHELKAQIEPVLRAALTEEMRQSEQSQLSDTLKKELRQQLEHDLRAELEAPLRALLEAEIKNQLESETGYSIPHSQATKQAKPTGTVNFSVMGSDTKNIVEAILFAADKPLSTKQIQLLYPELERPELKVLKQVIESITHDYAHRSVGLTKLASGYRFQVKEGFTYWVSRLLEDKPPRYSRALLETLSIIAYRQPVTRGDIEDIRGVGVSSSIIRTLLEREWIKIIAYKEVPGRPALYGSTKQFLDYFNLSSLEELPTLEAVKELDLSNSPHISTITTTEKQISEKQTSETKTVIKPPSETRH